MLLCVSYAPSGGKIISSKMSIIVAGPRELLTHERALKAVFIHLPSVKILININKMTLGFFFLLLNRHG